MSQRFTIENFEIEADLNTTIEVEDEVLKEVCKNPDKPTAQELLKIINDDNCDVFSWEVVGEKIVGVSYAEISRE